MKDYLNCFKKYAVFDGRSSRKEFWMFFLFNFIILSILYVGGSFLSPSGAVILSILSLIYSLIILIPVFSNTVRRLHDIDRSGWWVFINVIPILGWIIFFVFTVMGSQSGENKYGPHPEV